MTEVTGNTSGDMQTTRETEFRALEMLPKPIRMEMHRGLTDFAPSRVLEAWLERSEQGEDIFGFIVLYRKLDKQSTKERARETYGPDHPQA